MLPVPDTLKSTVVILIGIKIGRCKKLAGDCPPSFQPTKSNFKQNGASK